MNWKPVPDRKPPCTKAHMSVPVAPLDLLGQSVGANVLLLILFLCSSCGEAASSDTCIFLSVTYELKKTLSENILLSNGYIPVARKPAVMF